MSVAFITVLIASRILYYYIYNIYIYYYYIILYMDSHLGGRHAGYDRSQTNT